MMDDDRKERLGDAVDDLLERNREAMQQHGELGGTTNKDELAPDESDDPLRADPDDVERSIEHLRDRAVERASEEDGSLEAQPDELVGE